MENKEFYLKYLSYQPVPIETHYTIEEKRERPLITVAHLISAFQRRPGSLLGTTDSSRITLHHDANAPFIPVNTILSSIEAPFGSYEKPFIIHVAKVSQGGSILNFQLLICNANARL